MFHTSNISILGPHTCSHFVILLRLFDLKINKRRRIVCFQKLNFPKRIQRKAEKNGFFLETLHSHSASQKVDRPPKWNQYNTKCGLYIYIYIQAYTINQQFGIFFSRPPLLLPSCLLFPSICHCQGSSIFILEKNVLFGISGSTNTSWSRSGSIC